MIKKIFSTALVLIFIFTLFAVALALQNYYAKIPDTGVSGAPPLQTPIERFPTTPQNTEPAPAYGTSSPILSAGPSVLLTVPFTSQAPLGNWSDPWQETGCEEAAAVMAMGWVYGKNLTPEEALAELTAISKYEVKQYGIAYDSSTQDTVSHIFNGYFKYTNVEQRKHIGVDDVKNELSRGNLVILPVNGRKLNNPYFTPPGPIEHVVVIIGYDDATEEFITHDPGTRHGAEYRYPYNVLDAAIQDYPTGAPVPIQTIEKNMIVVKK